MVYARVRGTKLTVDMRLVSASLVPARVSVRRKLTSLISPKSNPPHFGFASFITSHVSWIVPWPVFGPFFYLQTASIDSLFNSPEKKASFLTLRPKNLP